MKESFRRMKGVRLPYRRQGLIFFTLRCYQDMAGSAQQRIDARIRHAATGDAATEEALRAWCLHGETIESAALEHHVSESTLYRARKRLYEDW